MTKSPKTGKTFKSFFYIKKVDKLDIGNYHFISLLPHQYKLQTKIIKNRLTNKFDSCQPPEQAGFRKSFSTTDQLHYIKIVVEKCIEHKIQNFWLSRAMSSIPGTKQSKDWLQIKKYFELYLQSGHTESKYKRGPRSSKDQNRLGVWQVNTISPKLFTSALEDIFRN